jgi:hypothetical protein
MSMRKVREELIDRGGLAEVVPDRKDIHEKTRAVTWLCKCCGSVLLGEQCYYDRNYNRDAPGSNWNSPMLIVYDIIDSETLPELDAGRSFLRLPLGDKVVQLSWGDK